MAENKWINASTDKYELRDTLFNRSVAIMPKSLDEMAKGFDGLFSNLTSYLDEVSSVKLYPFPVVDDSVQVGQMTTMHGTDAGVWVANLGYNTRIYNMGWCYIPVTDFTYMTPYSKYVLWLPWFSFVDIDPTKVANRYLLVRLSVDYQTGQGQYILSTTTKYPGNQSDISWYYRTDIDSNAERVIATYTFNLGIDIPLGESNASDLTRNLMLGAVKASVGIATGMSLIENPVSTTIKNTVSEDVSKGFARGDYKGARMVQRSERRKESTKTNTNTTYSNPVREISGSAMNGLATLNYNNNSGSGDRSNQPMLLWDMPTYPRMLVYRARVSPVDDTFKHLFGQPLAINTKLSMVGGFTKVANVHVEGIPATDSELDMIQAMLYQGVILPKATTTIMFIFEGVGSEVVDRSYSDVISGYSLEVIYRTKAYKEWYVDPTTGYIYNAQTGEGLYSDDCEWITINDVFDSLDSYYWNSEHTIQVI